MRVAPRVQQIVDERTEREIEEERKDRQECPQNQKLAHDTISFRPEFIQPK